MHGKLRPIKKPKGINMSIETILEGLPAEQIRAVKKAISDKGNLRRIDTTRRERRLAKNDLYFSVAPLPYKTDYETYKKEAEAIRQQVISGVDICLN